MTSFVTTPSNSTIFHMERDLFIEGNILYSTGKQLRTTDGNSTTLVYAGSISNNSYIAVDGFVQTSKAEVIFVDRWNSCLRSLTRSKNHLYNLTGDCERSGFADGFHALFDYPLYVVQDNTTPCLLYVTDYSNRAVRMVVKSSRPYVTTLISDANRPYFRIYVGITQAHHRKYLYITHNDGLECYDQITNTTVDLILASHQFGDDALIYDSSLGTFLSIILYKGLIIMADYRHNRIFTINPKTRSTAYMCTGVAGQQPGNLSICQLYSPLGLLEDNGDIYIGDKYGIKVIKGE